MLNWFTKSSKFGEGFDNNGLLRSLPTAWFYYQYWYNKPGNICYSIKSWKKTLYSNIPCKTRIHESFVDICNLNNYDCYIGYESRVHRGHAEQLYPCHEHFLHKFCKKNWDNWYYTWLFSVRLWTTVSGFGFESCCSHLIFRLVSVYYTLILRMKCDR